MRHYISLKLFFDENNENSTCHVAETLNTVLAFCQITITVLTKYQPNLYAFYTPETVIFFLVKCFVFETVDDENGK